jgi:MFS family permease
MSTAPKSPKEWKRFAVDISPLTKYPDFRAIWSAGFATYIGSMVTYVALPFQIKLLTNSYLAVGLMGAVEIIPLVIFGLYGGVLADKVDRKKMVWATEFLAMTASIILFINSRVSHPHLILLYIVAAAFAALNGLQRPSLDAILPRVVSHADLPSASALMSLRYQMGVIAGPALAGLILASFGVSVAYLIDIASFIISLYFLWRISSILPVEKIQGATLTNLIEGLRYAVGRKDLLGTYLVDLSAMFFAMPTALYPFWADQLHARWALGLFYAAVPVGALLITITSGWMRNYPRHGRAVFFAALGWGVAITLAGASKSLFLTLFFLVIAGASDQISALFRSSIWNQSIPDELRGRLAGIEMLSYSVGPLGGQLRAGSMAAWTTLRTSVVGGGVICIGFIAIAASALPKFRKYDLRTNEFAVAQRIIREKSSSE